MAFQSDQIVVHTFRLISVNYLLHNCVFSDRLFENFILNFEFQTWGYLVKKRVQLFLAIAG
jgi:hypothetical protein